MVFTCTNGLSANAKAFSVEKLIEKSQNSNITVELCSAELWEKFNHVGTEMIITKAGRRMFPTLKVRFRGLTLSTAYIVYVVLQPVGTTRFRYLYNRSKWVPAGSATTTKYLKGSNYYIHPDSPAPGSLWMSQGHIDFDKIKLTNNHRPIVRGQVSLHSMHKYQPCIHILEVNDATPNPKDLLNFVLEENHRAAIFKFPHTVFITVTAYQNQEMTEMKIRSNPFAKGFREFDKPRKIKSDKDEAGQIQIPLHSAYQRVPIRFVIPPQPQQPMIN